MPSIVDFLNARLDEDEAVAKRASIGDHNEWGYDGEQDSTNSGEVYYRNTEDDNGCWSGNYYVTCDSEGLTPSVSDDVGPHIARHDPARVLREITAKREIIKLAAHINWMDCVSQVGDSVLEEMAAVYAGHPDYDHSWG